MIDLNKPIRRVLASSDRKGRRLICTLEPGDIITFRPKGLRRTVSVHLGFCIQLAQAYTIQHEYDQKLADYNAKKKAGMRRLRKPNRPMFPFGKLVIDTINKR